MIILIIIVILILFILDEKIGGLKLESFNSEDYHNKYHSSQGFYIEPDQKEDIDLSSTAKANKDEDINCDLKQQRKSMNNI